MSYSRYDRGEYRPQFGGFSFFPPVIRAMIIANVGVFILQFLLERSFLTVGGSSLGEWFIRTFYLWPIDGGFKIWQLFTYMFLHGGFWHIFMNMLMLWMFGMEVENAWGARKFLYFYMACGLAAGLSNLFIAPLFSEPGPTIGASGSVYGVMVAFAMLFPNRYVYFYFFIPVKAKYLIIFLIGFEVFYGVTGLTDGVAHMAHLGGAVVAALWVVMDSRGVIDRLLFRMDTRRSRRPEQSTSLRNPGVQDATYFDISGTGSTQPPRDPKLDRYQKLIDDILDKISKSGYSALTEDEKRILLDASKKIHPDRGADA